MRRIGDWAITYRSVYNPDGSLLFPEKLTEKVLEQKKREQGSFIFANQYLNEILPEDMRGFKKEWFQYYHQMPDVKYTFAMVDPAISMSNDADYTATVVIDVDRSGHWYVRYARRERITPTQIVNGLFRLQDQFQCMSIGIETIAYQEALIYMLKEESRRRGVYLPITEIKDMKRSKEQRVFSLVPRFEWGRISLAPTLTDLELELLQFPRGEHDDLADALAHLESFAMTPEPSRRENHEPHPSTSEYESHYIRNISKRNEGNSEE